MDRQVTEAERQHDEGERHTVLSQLEGWLERPMQLLGFVWLGLLILELTRGLSPPLVAASTVIWVLFIADFALRLALAPDRGHYLRRNWLTVLSLIVPALRVLRVARAFRVLRLARAGRGIRLVKVVGSINRTMHALRRGMERRGLGYIVLLTLVVALAGAAGMYAFERDVPGGSLGDYPTALWWTAMIMTTMGSDYWPVTTEGRVLCGLLAIYAFTVFGYVTASLASFFIGRDAEDAGTAIADAAGLRALRADIAALRLEVRALRTPGEPLGPDTP